MVTRRVQKESSDVVGNIDVSRVYSFPSCGAGLTSNGAQRYKGRLWTRFAVAGRMPCIDTVVGRILFGVVQDTRKVIGQFFIGGGAVGLRFSGAMISSVQNEACKWSKIAWC